MPTPRAYFITFTCYGHHLHGDDEGSVDKDHNAYGAPMLAANPARNASEEQTLTNSPYHLDQERRSLVLKAIHNLCLYRKWELMAAHVRTTHVHAVVGAETGAEKILHDMKAYATRLLNESGLDGAGIHRWTRHGSTRYLWDSEAIGLAIDYVIRQQGEPMAVGGTRVQSEPRKKSEPRQ